MNAPNAPYVNGPNKALATCTDTDHKKHKNRGKIELNTGQLEKVKGLFH